MANSNTDLCTITAPSFHKRKLNFTTTEFKNKYNIMYIKNVPYSE